MKRTISLLLAAALCLAVISGCSSKKDAPKTERESVVLAETSEWWGNDTTLLDGSSFCQALVAEPLVTIDEEGNMHPCIASAVSVSDDGLTITLTIPTGMKFASGEELLPEDVAASLNRFKKVSPFSANLDPVESIEVDGQDVILHLSEFTSDISVNLAGSFITVQDKDVLDVSSDDDLLWGAQPYGMYYLVDYVQGSHVELKRNPYFFTNNPFVENKGPAKIENVTVRFISEEFSLVNALNVGDVQAAFSLTADGLTQLTRDDAEVIQRSSIPQVEYLEFNLSSPILSDPKVREALALAVDRDILVEANNGIVVPTWSIVTEKVTNHNADFAAYYKETYGTNIVRAKELLAEAGWSDSDGDGYLDKDGEKLSLRIVGNDGALENKTIQSLQIQYKEIGVDLVIEMYANYYHYDVIFERDYDIGLEHWGWSEPILTLNMILTDTQNLADCGQEEDYFDAVALASHTIDSDERTAMIYDIEKILSDNIITVPLFSAESIFVFAGVSGIDIIGNGSIYFNDME